MGLFTKSVPIDETFTQAMVQADGRSRGQVGNEQDAIRQALRPDEDASVIAVDRQGNGVFVVTGERLLRFRNRALQQEAALSQISDMVMSQSGYHYVTTAKPNMEIRLDTFEQANAFQIAADPRDIPPLYPDFFRRILTGIGLPVTQENMARLNERVAMAIGVGGAISYFMQTGDQQARIHFEKRFDRGGPPERLVHVCDDMIDWLWQWRATCHAAVRKLVPAIEATMVGDDSPIRSASGEVPPLAGSGFPEVAR